MQVVFTIEVRETGRGGSYRRRCCANLSAMAPCGDER